MTVSTRSQMHGHSRHGATRCALGNRTNAHDGSSPKIPVRKATPKKKPKPRHNVTPKKTNDPELEELLVKPTNLFQSEASAGISKASSASNTASASTRKTYKNVHWRSQSGLLTLTDKCLVFRTLHSKRLRWDSIQHHEIRTHHHVQDDCDNNKHENPVLHRNKYLLKLTMRTAGAPAIILRFASHYDLDDADREITRQLQWRSLQVFDRVYGTYTAEPKTSYYPIVRLCGSIPGRLVLDATQFVFEPLTSNNNNSMMSQQHWNLPTMTIPWTRLVSFDMKTTGNLQTSMSLSCQNSPHPIIFQFSSLRELERLHRDIQKCLEWTEHNEKANNEANNNKPLLLSPEMTMMSDYSTPGLESSQSIKKRVTFSSPLILPKTVSPSSSPVSRMRSLSPKALPKSRVSLGNRISQLSRTFVGLLMMGLQVWVTVEMVDTIGIAMTRFQPPPPSTTMPVLLETKGTPFLTAIDTNDLVFQTVTQGVTFWMKKDMGRK